MAMVPFSHRFPDCAVRETPALRILDQGLSLPPGEYVFHEWYCDDPSCDCRRVLIRVHSTAQPGLILATINYGWESTVFYTRWMHGDEEAGRDITDASLDPINPQSGLAEALLDGFQGYVKNDPFFPQQLRRHYDLFKSTQTGAASDTPGPHPPSSMTTGQILSQLKLVPEKADFAPYEATLRAAAQHRDTITPELIASLDRVTANPAPYLKNYRDCQHLFAIYLLAQFRETRALDAFLRFFSLPGEQALDLTGEMITENGAAVLVSVCGGDPAPLLKLIHDESVNEFVRTQAIDGLLVQAGWGERSREHVIEDLRRLFQTLPKPGDASLWAGLVCTILDFNALELIPEARQAFAEDLVDESVIGLDDLEPAVSTRPGMFTPPSHEERFRLFCERNAPIDAVKECSLWLCFRDDPDDYRPIPRGSENDIFAPSPGLPPLDLPPYAAPQPYIAPPKIGRNDPCSCGSGRKYKKCCG